MPFESVLTLCRFCEKEIVVNLPYEERNKPCYCSKACRDAHDEPKESILKLCEHGNTFNCLPCEVQNLKYVIDELIEQNEQLKHRIPREVENELRSKIERYEDLLEEIRYYATTQTVIKPYQILGRINAELGEESPQSMAIAKGRLQFIMYIDDFCLKNGGISSKFINGNGDWSTSWWSSPPEDIDHVSLDYIQDRYSTARTKRHEEFIKQRFKEEMKRLNLKE
jgi:hypothetical protein